MLKKLAICFFCCLAAIANKLCAQVTDSAKYTTVVAGKHYDRSKFYQSLWGKHYRKEWATPTKFKVVMLDTLAGGLTPYEAGGSRQSKNIKLRDHNNREYVLRSIDKDFAGVLPPIAKGTFIESLAHDQASIAHPYAAVTIPPMAEAVGIYHTNPAIYYIPKQKALGKFNDQFGDALYLFEQRPDENWTTAPNFGNAKDIKSTPKMLQKIHDDNDNSVDQEAFLRARLFDMVIGDWGRHEDQWRWAEMEDGKQTVYVPIPRDRDQAYTLFDGVLVKSAKRAARAKHLQTFSYKIKNVNAFNYPARNLDRHLLNALPREAWTRTAADIQLRLTDQVIDNALRLLPPEVYNISGPEIAAKIKSRRDHLVEYAEKYYKVLAKNVDITGSAKREFFEVKRMANDSVLVNIYKINKSGEVKDKPFYSRTFYGKQTSEIRLYGLDGEDEYVVTGDTRKSISVRLIGGFAHDKFNDQSHVKGIGHKTEIYDDHNNEFKKTSETSLHLSEDTAVHAFKYNSYKFDKIGFKGTIFYTYDDRLFVGLNHITTKNKWRKEPYGFTRLFGVNYSIIQNSFSFTYKSRFTKLFGNWDGVFYANYDFVRWTNFFGLGNETKLVETNRDFNRMVSNNYIASAGVERVFKNRHKLTFTAFYKGVDIKNDTSRFVSKIPGSQDPGFYKNNGFAGLNADYLYQVLDDSVLPRKGISFLAGLNYTHNLRDNHRTFGKFTTEANVYVPLTKKFGLAFVGGGAALFGSPVFYQYNTIGGGQTLRAYRRERFSGDYTVYSQNELQWITPVHSYLYNGRIGFFALYDIGRVWLSGEKSNKWHSGYGGGIILSPFNLISVTLAYGISAEESNVHLALIRAF